jgi:hypothetical protein
MPDPLGTTASALDILDRVAAASRWIWHRLTSRRPSQLQLHSGRHPHSGLELLPVSFEVSLNAQVPYVTITFHAVNYTSRPLLLDSGKTLQLSLGGGPVLDEIALVGESELLPRASRLVYFRRNLADSEARAVARNTSYPSPAASVAVVARAVARGRQVKYGPCYALAIAGAISGRTALAGAA